MDRWVATEVDEDSREEGFPQSRVFNKAVKSLIFKLFVPKFGFFFFLVVLSLFCGAGAQ